MELRKAKTFIYANAAFNTKINNDVQDLSVVMIDHTYRCSLKQYTEVESLSLKAPSHSHQVASLQIFHLPSLRKLRKLQLHGGYRGFSDIKRVLLQCPALEELSITDIEELTDIAFLTELKNLKKLHLGECNQVQDWTILGQLALQEIRLIHNNTFDSIDSLQDLSHLEVLEITWAHVATKKAMTNLQALEKSSKLHSLFFTNCHPLSDISVLSALPNVQELKLSNCGVQDFSPVAGLPLVKLDLADSYLSDLQSLGKLEKLEELHLGNCKRLESLTGLDGFPQLKHLVLSPGYACTPPNRDYSILSKCPGLLQGLYMPKAGGYRALSNKKRLFKGDELLVKLWALNHPEMTATLASLEYIDLSGASHLYDLKCLRGAKNLKKLRLTGCRNLADLSVLSELSSLVELEINGLSQPLELPALGDLQELQKVSLKDSTGFTFIWPLISSQKLTQIDLSGIKKMTPRPPRKGISTRDHVEQLQEKLLRWLTRLKDPSAEQAQALQHYQQLKGDTAKAPIGDEQKKQLAQIRKLLNAQDWTTINMALSLIDSLDDKDIIQLLSQGNTISPEGTLQLSKNNEIHKRVRASFRANVALYFARRAGLLDHVQQLRLQNLKLINLDFLEGLRKLKTLDLSGNSQLKEISSLRTLTSLETLHLQKCEAIQDLQPLANLSHLSHLDISDCGSIQSLSSLSGLASLQTIHANNCSQLNDLSKIAPLDKLKFISLHNCDALTDISPLARLGHGIEVSLAWTDLDDLHIDGFEKLRTKTFAEQIVLQKQ